MTETYVLPSLNHDDDELLPSSVFANWRRRASSTPTSNHSHHAIAAKSTNQIASPLISSKVRPILARQSTSFLASQARSPPMTTDYGHSIERERDLSVSLMHSPTPQKRISSMRNNINNRKNSPTSPISATPSLTFSYSSKTTGSRSDEDALSSPTHSPISGNLGGVLSSSDSFYRKGKLAASVGNLRFLPNEDDSFLPSSNDGRVSDMGGSLMKKKSTIGFQSIKRNPDKVAHLLGEEYEESQRQALCGQMNSKSTTSLSSPSKAAFKGLFNSMRGKKKKDENVFNPMESAWEREVRLEERKQEEDKKKKESVAKTMELLNQFSLDRQINPTKKQVRVSKDLPAHSSQTVEGGAKGREKSRVKANDGESTDDAFNITSSLGLILHAPPSSQRDNEESSKQLHVRTLSARGRHPHYSDDSNTLVGSGRHARVARRRSIASINVTEENFLRMSESSHSGESQSHHTRTPSDLSSASGSNKYLSENESFLPHSRQRENSIDALSRMLQPSRILSSARQEDDEVTYFPTFGDFSNRGSEDGGRIKASDTFQSQSRGRAVSDVAQSDSKQSLAEICRRFYEQTDMECLTPKGLPALLEPVDGNVGKEERTRASSPSINVMPSLQFLGKEFDQLSPLTAHAEECWKANQKQQVRRWGKVKLLTSSSSREKVPKGWAGYVRSYANGDLDLNNPPAPRSAPLVTKAIPRPSSRDPYNSATWSFTVGSISSPQSTSTSNPKTYSMLSASHLPNLPPTPPIDSEFRGRLVDQRLIVRQARPSSDDDIRIQAEELAAVGGLGDIRGPRPTWEAERNDSAQEYVDLSSLNQPISALKLIVEDLAEELQVRYASVQILLGEEAINLASWGSLEGSRISLDVYSTPRLDSVDDDDDVVLDEGIKALHSRDDTLDAHTILSRDGAALVIPDMTKDWRFDRREEALDMPFYAGISIFASDTCLPIGTVSVKNDQAKILSGQEKKALADAARAIEGELKRVRKERLEKKLQVMDESIRQWIHSAPSTPRSPAVTLPPNPHRPTAASRLAERRGARKPAPIETLQSLPATTNQEILYSRLGDALETITATLSVDLAYIARVRSSPLECNIEIQREVGSDRVGRLRPDPAMHLCALAALKSGLQFEDDEEQVMHLIGEEMQQEGEAKSVPRFGSALIVSCGGSKEGVKNYRGTEGWVLSVAYRGGRRLKAETGFFLMKFAALIGPLLMMQSQDGSSKPSYVSTLKPESKSMLLSMSSTSPVLLTPRCGSLSRSSKLPFTSTSSSSTGIKKRIPLASPPPSSPLPLPPAFSDSITNFEEARRRRQALLRSSYSGSGRSNISRNEDIEVLESEDGHFEKEKIGRGESPLGIVNP